MFCCDFIFFFFFFFQAEDGIRDHCVTGVQTCALPIYVVFFADCNVLTSYLLLPLYLKERVNIIYVMEESEVSSINLMYMIVHYFKQGKK